MRAVGELMTADVVTLAATQPLQEAVNLLAQREFGHIPIVAGTRLAGILSDRDVLRALARDQALETPVASIMRPPVYVTQETPVRDAIHMLMEHHIHCLPVVRDDEVLVGILTTTDLMRALLFAGDGAPSAASAPPA